MSDRYYYGQEGFNCKVMNSILLKYLNEEWILMGYIGYFFLIIIELFVKSTVNKVVL